MKTLKNTKSSFRFRLLFPEVIGTIEVVGRSSDLSLFANAFPERWFQWLGMMFATYTGYTAAGTVRDSHSGSLFHRIDRTVVCKPIGDKDNSFFNLQIFFDFFLLFLNLYMRNM